MAQAPKPIQRIPFKRGDTKAITYQFKPPFVGFNWSTVLADVAYTAVKAPIDNNGAAALRLNQPLTVDANNVASYTFQLTHTESLTFTPGATYVDECQLKENGSQYFTTAITGQTLILQDYVI